MTAEIKGGDKVKICLVATTTALADRVSRGITQDVFIGVAACDLVEGSGFVVITGGGKHTLKTSPVKYIGTGMFTTNNSTYSVEKI